MRRRPESTWISGLRRIFHRRCNGDGLHPQRAALLRTLAEIAASCGAAELFLGMRKGEYGFLSAHRLRT